MNIYEATTIALKTGRGIRRDSWADGFIVVPTNTSERCICTNYIAENLCRGWEPKADDLMADDWEA